VETRPTFRRLRGYAFDPSLSIRSDTAIVNEIVFQVPWEDALKPGPVGEYLEIVDYDPASRCFYQPVDLNSPVILAQDGFPPSEGTPQFHQQMVYAVAMLTIRNFERALGRKAQWAPHHEDVEPSDSKPARDSYVQQLRIYPHALREANAYYSPARKAVLFGYFPAMAARNAGEHLPGGTVFTCLSHDIIAHEVSHALLDGMHRRFIEATNPDGLAFHEAFADLVALFQHFTFADVLRHQIARTRGDLSSQNLLGELAQQLGSATGHYGALRDAIGRVENGKWQRMKPNPADYSTVMEPHARGAILVGAIFDAFLSIYNRRAADLFRIASSGTGVLPEGQLHPDLVNRLADEAAKAAQHVLTICIRALDYCPPVDLTFGDYFRALLTADADLVPDDDLRYRVAFIESFRQRGIYPHDVRTLSLDNLVWERIPARSLRQLSERLRDFCSEHQYWGNRSKIHEQTEQFRRSLHTSISEKMGEDQEFEELTGMILSKAVEGIEIDSNGRPRFEVHAVRPAQRVGPDGDALNQVVISLTQKRRVRSSAEQPAISFRGGCTLIFDLDSESIRYSVRKPIQSESRLHRQRRYLADRLGDSPYSMYFSPESREPFAMLHRNMRYAIKR
jgi:hypothetical protein